jgi:hypothetical protein
LIYLYFARGLMRKPICPDIDEILSGDEIFIPVEWRAVACRVA